MAGNFAEALRRAVETCVLEAAGELREQAIREAVEQFERDLRKEVAVAAMSVQSRYRVEHMRDEIAIFVKIEDVRATT